MEPIKEALVRWRQNGVWHYVDFENEEDANAAATAIEKAFEVQNVYVYVQGVHYRRGGPPQQPPRRPDIGQAGTPLGDWK